MEGHSYIEDIAYLLAFSFITVCVVAVFIMACKSIQGDNETKKQNKI